MRKIIRMYLKAVVFKILLNLKLNCVLLGIAGQIISDLVTMRWLFIKLYFILRSTAKAVHIEDIRHPPHVFT
jgi:hypothetical protein